MRNQLLSAKNANKASTSNSVDSSGMKEDKLEVVIGEVNSTVDTAKKVEVKHENEDKASEEEELDNSGMKEDKLEVVIGEVVSTVADIAKKVEVKHENEDAAEDKELEEDWDARSWGDADVQIPVKSAFDEDDD